MKLPNSDRAVVDIAKLRDYCLNPAHPRGRHKARVFAAALGLTAEVMAPDVAGGLVSWQRAAEAVRSSP